MSKFDKIYGEIGFPYGITALLVGVFITVLLVSLDIIPEDLYSTFKDSTTLFLIISLILGIILFALINDRYCILDGTPNISLLLLVGVLVFLIGINRLLFFSIGITPSVFVVLYLIFLAWVYVRVIKEDSVRKKLQKEDTYKGGLNSNEKRELRQLLFKKDNENMKKHLDWLLFWRLIYNYLSVVILFAILLFGIRELFSNHSITETSVVMSFIGMIVWNGTRHSFELARDKHEYAQRKLYEPFKR